MDLQNVAEETWLSASRSRYKQQHIHHPQIWKFIGRDTKLERAKESVFTSAADMTDESFSNPPNTFEGEEQPPLNGNEGVYEEEGSNTATTEDTKLRAAGIIYTDGQYSILPEFIDLFPLGTKKIRLKQSSKTRHARRTAAAKLEKKSKIEAFDREERAAAEQLIEQLGEPVRRRVFASKPRGKTPSTPARPESSADDPATLAIESDELVFAKPAERLDGSPKGGPKQQKKAQKKRGKGGRR